MREKILLAMLLLLPIALLAQNKNIAIDSEIVKKPDVIDIKQGYTITGFIKGMDKGIITIRYRREGNDIQAPVETDSVVVKNGHFTFTGSVSTPVYCTIWQPDYLEQIKFWLENASIKIDGSVYSDDIQISGSKTQDEDVLFHNTYDYYSNKLAAASYEVKEAKKRMESQAVIEKAEKERDSLLKCQRGFGEKFLREHPNSQISLTYLYNCPSDEVERLFGYLSEDLQSSGGGKILIKKINSIRNSAIGKLLPDCTQMEASGKEINFSEYKGKYLLIYISSGLQQEYIIKLKQLYSNYSTKGLETVQVIINAKNKEELGKLSETYQIPWKLVSDFKNFGNQVNENLNINTYPSFFLVDPKGIILDRDLSLLNLEKRLEKIF